MGVRLVHRLNKDAIASSPYPQQIENLLEDCILFLNDYSF